MRILVNASTCSVAGGRSVALNFLRSYAEGGFPYELVAYVPEGRDFESLRGPRLRVETSPALVQRPWARPWTDYVWWRRVMKREAPDVLFSMGSIAYPTSVPQVVLFHWPYAIYPDRQLWDRMPARARLKRGLRRRLFGSRAPYADCFAAQTETARSRLESIWGLRNVEVVPNAVSLPQPGAAGGLPTSAEAQIPPGKRALLCLSRYYPHKNLEILLDVGRAIRDRGLPWVIWTTVSARESVSCAAAKATSSQQESTHRSLIRRFLHPGAACSNSWSNLVCNKVHRKVEWRHH